MARYQDICKLVARYQDILISSAREAKCPKSSPLPAPRPKDPFEPGHASWWQDTNMARYHENILFTIQKLCFQGAKATKISIFWYPKTPPKQLSGRAGAKMGWGGGAKPAAKQPSWCQDAKISRFPSRARPSAPTGRVSLLCLGDPKSIVLVRFLHYDYNVDWIHHPPGN